MGPGQLNLDVMSSRLRRVESRVAMLEDAVQVHGPAPARLPIPELSREQKVTVGYLVAMLFLTAVSVIASRKVDQ